LSRLRTLLLIDGKSDLVASERLFDPGPGQGGK
jgi:hypothetical protein